MKKNIVYCRSIVIIVALIYFLIYPVRTNAQMACVGGVNFSDIRNNVVLQNKNAITSYQWGLSFQYFPFKRLEKVSVINEFLFNHKGYMQDLETDYHFRFNYLSFPILANYSLFRALSVQSGVEFSKLLSTNVLQGRRTYNDFDLGLVLGMSCYDTRRVSFYSRITYGITPMPDYYRIDDLGNFSSEIHDLKNVCISVGVKFKFYHEKIHLYR